MGFAEMIQALRRLATLARCRFFFMLIAVFALGISSCGHGIPRLGMGGRYLEGRDEVTKATGNVDKAIVALESVVRQDPLYQDSLTLLGRAYYKKGRYQDARQILQRALVVNKEDEIAWVVSGITELRLGQNEKGFENLKGGLTLLSKVSRPGYKGYTFWDYPGTVSLALRRTILLATKGIEEKDNLVRATEILLSRIDDEESKSRLGEQMKVPQQ